MTDYRERVYLISIFQLSFASQEKRTDLYLSIEDWKMLSALMPGDIYRFFDFASRPCWGVITNTQFAGNNTGKGATCSSLS